MSCICCTIDAYCGVQISHTVACTVRSYQSCESHEQHLAITCNLSSIPVGVGTKSSLSKSSRQSGFTRLIMSQWSGLICMVQSTHHSFEHFPKDHVPSIQPRCLDSGDEELGAIGVLASIGHAEPPRPFVLQFEVLVWKFVPINTFAWTDTQARDEWI